MEEAPVQEREGLRRDRVGLEGPVVARPPWRPPSRRRVSANRLTPHVAEILLPEELPTAFRSCRSKEKGG